MRIRFWIPGLLALTGLVALVAVQQRIDRQHVSFEKQESLLYLSSGKYVKRLTFGYDGLLAGLYWTRAVQHYGSERQGLKRYNLLGNLLDITTTLDPDLLLAYRWPTATALFSWRRNIPTARTVPTWPSSFFKREFRLTRDTGRSGSIWDLCITEI